MAYFVATYDLKKKNEFDYQYLWDEFNRINGHKYQGSCYLIERDTTSSALYNLLRQHMHEDDALFVAEFSKKPKAGKCLPGTKNWIDSRFP